MVSCQGGGIKKQLFPHEYVFGAARSGRQLVSYFSRMPSASCYFVLDCIARVDAAVQAGWLKHSRPDIAFAH